MGLQLKLFADEQEDPGLRQRQTAAYYNHGVCNTCPFACDGYKRYHPRMPATGAERPLVYVLGEGAGETEDETGEQFTGKSGQVLRERLPRAFRDKVRYNNVTNCRPPGNKTPDFAEIESCRSRVVADIERSRPKIILAFGNVALDWATGWSGVLNWRGRRTPVKIGNHTCWLYAVVHPSWLLRNGMPTEDVRVFNIDLRRAFQDLEALPPARPHDVVTTFAGIQLLYSVLDIKRALAWASQQPALGLDYETNALRPYTAGAKILTVALGTAQRSFAFPLDHKQADWKAGERDDIINIWCRFLEQTAARKIVHNLAFELEWTGHMFGRQLIRAGRWEDTSSQAVVIDERTAKQKSGPFSLEFLVRQYFGFDLKALSGLDRAALNSVALEKVLRYNAADAKYHYLLWQEQQKVIAAAGLEPAYQLALRRVPTVVLTQMNGLPVDQEAVERLRRKYESTVKKLRARIPSYEIVQDFQRDKGREFNPASHPDCVHLFWKMLRRPECQVTDKYSKKPRLSVDEDVLATIPHPLAKTMVAWRKAGRQLSTYILPLRAVGEQSVVFPDQLIHSNFNTVFARTGRLSSDSPNLQNFPKRDAEAMEVRESITAPPGCTIVAADLGQIEARVIAMFTKDRTFVRALWENYDVHMEWAERLARAYPRRIGGKDNLTDKKVMKSFRTDVKNQWTFPLFFGASCASAAGYLGIPEETLAPLYRDFWQQFSGVKAWQERQLQFYHQKGYVECLTGRRRHAPLSVNMVYNSPVQGTAAELIMDMMARLSETGDAALQPDLQIHDDLTWVRVPESAVEAHVERVLDIMLQPAFPWINVPLTAEVSIGPNWAALQDAGTFSSDSWFK